MATDKNEKSANRIPVRFADEEDSTMHQDETQGAATGELDDVGIEPADAATEAAEAKGGPEVAELVASRAELKRLQTALAEAKDAIARRQADFENYRKRVERERSETYSRVVVEVGRKLLPVVDNLGRALDAEKSVEAKESREFKHFLHGVELIAKQLNDVLTSLGIEPIVAVGELFDPHIHEAVATEPSDEFEPDTVTEEIARGYRIGERLLRPSMVKVAARKDEGA